MKKLILISFLVSVILSGCFTNRLVIGDKPLDKIEKSVEIYNTQIEDYLCQIDELVEDKTVLREKDSTSNGLLTIDGLIEDYEQKINQLEKDRDRFLMKSAGKDYTTNFELLSDNPTDIARAYYLIKYADADMTKVSGPQVISENYQGMIVNELYEPAVVTVTDPIGRVQELLVPKRSQQKFGVFMQGLHHFHIRSVNTKNETTVSKDVSAMTKYFVEGQRFDLLVTVMKIR